MKGSPPINVIEGHSVSEVVRNVSIWCLAHSHVIVLLNDLSLWQYTQWRLQRSVTTRHKSSVYLVIILSDVNCKKRKNWRHIMPVNIFRSRCVCMNQSPPTPAVQLPPRQEKQSCQPRCVAIPAPPVWLRSVILAFNFCIVPDDRLNKFFSSMSTWKINCLSTSQRWRFLIVSLSLLI